MNIGRLKHWLYDMQNEGYGDYVLHFCDQDGDSYTIDYVYCDDDGDCCLQSNNYDDNDFSVNELLDELEPYDYNDYVYVEHDDDDDDNIIWEQIDGVWYYDDDEEELTIDMHYEYD